MTRSVALIAAAMVLAACDGSKRHADGNAIVVVRNQPDVHTNAVESIVAQQRPSPVVTPPPPSGLDAPPIVSGTFTDTPLPLELAHLKNLGTAPITTPSKPEERIP